MTYDPKARTRRQRETRRAERQTERHIAKATLRDAVRAIGAGDAEDWPQEPMEGGQERRDGSVSATDTPEAIDRPVARKNGASSRPDTPTGDSA